MIGQLILVVVGVLAVILGLKGFRPEGIPWTSTKNITGTPAKAIGVLTITFGILLAFTVVAVRVLHALVSQGIVPPMDQWR